MHGLNKHLQAFKSSGRNRTFNIVNIICGCYNYKAVEPQQTNEKKHFTAPWDVVNIRDKLKLN